METLKSKKFENNPFFQIDVSRFGYKSAVFEWVIKSKNVGRAELTNPIRTCDCGGHVWHSATRPPLCFDCYELGMVVA